MNGRHGHQSMFADQGGQFRDRLPFPVVDMKCRLVHRCKGMRLPIGKLQEVDLESTPEPGVRLHDATVQKQS